MRTHSQNRVEVPNEGVDSVVGCVMVAQGKDNGADYIQTCRVCVSQMSLLQEEKEETPMEVERAG